MEQKRTNLAHLCMLMTEGATPVLRSLLDSYHDPNCLYDDVLQDTKAKNTLQYLRSKGMLTVKRWKMMYPSMGKISFNGSTVFDFPLLYVLLQNVCGLESPSTGWVKPPMPSDASREAYLVRLKLLVADICRYIKEGGVTDQGFEKCWSDIEDVLFRLGAGKCYESIFQNMKYGTMGYDDEQHFIDLLKELEEGMSKLDESQDTMKEERDNVAQEQIMKAMNDLQSMFKTSSITDQAKSSKTVTYTITAQGDAKVAVGDGASFTNYYGGNEREREKYSASKQESKKGVQEESKKGVQEESKKGVQEEHKKSVEDGLPVVGHSSQHEFKVQVQDMENNEVVQYFGSVSDLKEINADKVAESLAMFLNVDKTSMRDPPCPVMKKCRQFCRILIEIGRKDIVVALRGTLPSGMTGPLQDEYQLYQAVDLNIRLKLTKSLCENDLWRRLLNEFKLRSQNVHYYDRMNNPAEAILADVCCKRNLTVGELYDVLVRAGANAIADLYF